MTFPQALLLSLTLFGMLSCRQNTSEKELPQANTTVRELPLHHARQFRIEDHPSFTLLEVREPYPGARKPARYALLKEGQSLPDSIQADAVIQLPVRQLVVTSTSHLPALDMLGVAHSLLAFPNTSLISSAQQQERLKQGKLIELGAGQQPNIEKIMALQPELIMAFGMQADDAALESLRRTGIPVVLNADFLESSPLGRAEWIKFTAELFNKRDEADSIFNQIEQRYDSLARLGQKAQPRPSVFSGLMYGDVWYAPGGNSWAAQFIADAGGSYLWADTEASGSLQLSPEAVVNKASEADIWLNVANMPSLQALADTDQRYTLFKAWQQGKVYTYTARQTPGGGNAYLEEGYARPDLVLADLLQIFHPESTQGAPLYFYEKLD